MLVQYRCFEPRSKLTGWLNTLLKINKNTALMKLITQIEMLNTFVFLSMYGVMMLTAIKKTASIMSNATA